jgi:glycosyltransferase A (GT-A) superfamily protein (DUF2064 family)
VNPVNFFHLATLVAGDWAAIETQMMKSILSKSRAVYRPNGSRALSPLSYSPANLVDVRAKARGISKVLLVADISEFYNSIYTHSIAWALHTKAYAKAHQKGNSLGNKLDRAIQHAQHGQTIGIPIGPDTSLVIAELILSALEGELRKRIPKLSGFRFVDDFELCFRDYATAEKALAILQEELLCFELRLNPRKTSMRVPPVDLEHEWVSELRRFKIRDNSGQKGDLVAYFDLMTRQLTLYPNEHVSKYGLQRFKQFNPRPANLPLLQSMLCHIGVAEPGSIREVVEAMLFLRTGGHRLDARIIKESLSAVLRNSTPLGHHYEAAWALFGIIQFGIVLDRPTVVALSSTENSVVAILALDALAKGLAPRLNVAAWALRMKATDLREEEWLLSYEANVQGWLGSVGGGDHVANDPEFGFLKASGVRFYVP